MRSHVAPLLVLAVFACRPEPATSPVSPQSTPPVAAPSPPIPVGSAVMVRPGGTVWLDAARTQPIALPQRMPGGGIAMIVVVDHGETLEVDTATQTACASPLVGDFALRMFVAKSDLQPVTRVAIDHTISAQHRVHIAAGAPVDGEAGARGISIGVPEKPARVAVPDEDVALDLPAPHGGGPCVELFEGGKPAELTIGDAVIWAALVQGTMTYTGTTYRVKKGAKVWWQGGDAAGTVADDHTFFAPAAVAGTRSCLPLALADDNSTTLCFETKDLTEGSAGPGTIGLGNVGLIGSGKRVPMVRQAKATVKGALDKDIVRRIVRAHINEIRFCYNKALVRDPGTRGRVVVDFTIDATGAVETAIPQPSKIDDPELPTCMSTAVMRWKFPKPEDGGTVSVSYPFLLEPGD